MAYAPGATYSGQPAASASGGYSGLSTFSTALAVAGAVTQTIGSFYAVKSQQYGLKSQASSLEFEASMANLNARAAEQDAQYILDARNKEIGLLGMRTAQEKGAQRAATAARGIQGGVGSAAEVQASTELARQLDALTINVSATRAAEAQRTRAVDWRNQALLSRTSAQNLRGAAKSVNPWIAAGTSMLGSAGSVAPQWVYDRRSYPRSEGY